MAKTTKKSKSGDLGYEDKLYKGADKLRGNIDPGEYKHVILGLIFLKYISDAFTATYEKLKIDKDANEEEKDEYMAERTFWVPPNARWDALQHRAKNSKIGVLIDKAMIDIERDNPQLKGILSKNYARPSLDSKMLGELIDLFSEINTRNGKDKSRDVLGRVYEYFLGNFASDEGKGGGEYYTPPSVVNTMVEMLEPQKGSRVYDPCCGSGGMFVQSEKFIEAHGGSANDIAIYGQESNHTTWRLTKMNLVVRGMDAENIKWNSEGSFHKDALPDLKADYILANPPFNISDWGGGRLRKDVRWKYGIPYVGNANYAWMQHIIHHLAPNGTAGLVMANGSMSSDSNGEGDIRKKMIEGDVIDCIISLPSNLFYTVTVSACLWFFAKNKKKGKFRNRQGEILFIDAREVGKMLDKTHREFTDEDIKKISGTYHKWREGKDYKDIVGFCKSANLDEIKKQGYTLVSGRFVGIEEQLDDDIPFEEKLIALKTKLSEQFNESKKLTSLINKKLKLVEKNEQFKN